MQALFDFKLDAIRCGSKAHGGAFHLLRQQELCSQKKHENKTAQLHDRSDKITCEQGGKTRKGDEAVDHLHHSCAQSDKGGPFEPPPRALVHYRQVDWADRNAQQQGKNKPGEAGFQNGKQALHVQSAAAPFSSSSSSSISRRIWREMRGRIDRKSTRLNSSHVEISYAVF